VDGALAAEMEESLLNHRSELGEEELRSSIITLKHGFDQDDFAQDVDAHGPIDRPTLLEPLDHFLKLDERSLHRVTPPYDPRDWTGVGLRSCPVPRIATSGRRVQTRRGRRSVSGRRPISGRFSTP